MINEYPWVGSTYTCVDHRGSERLLCSAQTPHEPFALGARRRVQIVSRFLVLS
jgi:hypothetical protein